MTCIFENMVERKCLEPQITHKYEFLHVFVTFLRIYHATRFCFVICNIHNLHACQKHDLYLMMRVYVTRQDRFHSIKYRLLSNHNFLLLLFSRQSSKFSNFNFIVAVCKVCRIHKFNQQLNVDEFLLFISLIFPVLQTAYVLCLCKLNGLSLVWRVFDGAIKNTKLNTAEHLILKKLRFG